MTEPSHKADRKRLLTTLLAPLLGLLLLEVGLRVFDVTVLPLPVVQEELLVPVKTPQLRFVNRVNGWKRVTYAAGEREWTVHMNLNEDRFRGPRVARGKPEGVLRIACLGDSHTFGEGVIDGDTWPDHLRDLAGDGVEVINAGVDAYDTLQEALWYERFVEPFDPDVVLLAYFANDVAARGLGGGAAPDPLVVWTHPRQVGWIRHLREVSVAADVICDRIYNSRSQRARQASWNERYVAGDPGWKRSSEALLRLRDRCEASGRGFRVALFPYLLPQEDAFASSAALAVVQAFCSQNRIPCFDAEPCLLSELQDCDSFQDLRVAPMDFHANGRAHEVFARGLGQWLLDENVLPEGE